MLPDAGVSVSDSLRPDGFYPPTFENRAAAALIGSLPDVFRLPSSAYYHLYS